MVARHNYKRDSWQGKSSTESWHRDSRTANFHHMQFAHNRQHVKKRISDVRWCRGDHSTDQVLELSANCFEVIEHMARGHFGPLQPLMRLNFPHVVSYITISFNLQAAVTKKKLCPTCSIYVQKNRVNLYFHYISRRSPSWRGYVQQAGVTSLWQSHYT